MKKPILAISLAAALTACGGSDTPPEKEMTTEELTAAAASGDEDAMRELERQVAAKAKAAAAEQSDSLDVFQQALTSGDGSEARIIALAEAGNPNAKLWLAVSNRQNSDLSEIDGQLYRADLEEIATTGDNFRYGMFDIEDYPLSAEAAFQISEDKLTSKWLYDVDTDGAIAYLTKAAEGGHPGAMFKLATRYQYGLDLEQDLGVAKAWHEKAAAAGDGDAQTALDNWEEG